MSAQPPIVPLPQSKKIAYACGIVGWAIMVSVTWVVLVYIYDPPKDSGMVNLIPTVTYFSFLTVFSLILASGRLFDAITDPLIARFTDASRFKLGRRIPFMRFAIIPTVVFGYLMFSPIHQYASTLNIIWLGVMQFGFFLFMTIYNVPYNALLAELAHDSKQKVELSTWQAGGLLFGMVLASQILTLAGWLENQFNFEHRVASFQYAILCYSVVAGIFMAIPAWGINEKKYCRSKPLSIPMGPALRQTLSNTHFRYFIVADFSYWMAMTIIYASLLYYVTVLLRQPESFGSVMMAIMIVFSLGMFPFMGRITNAFGKKRPIIFSFIFLGFLMVLTSFLGYFPFALRGQGLLLAFATSVPLAFMSVLPTALLAELADLDGKKTGQQKEGLYFAVRNLSQKIGQTLGMMMVSVIMIYGKEPGDDLGIRLTGAIGLFLCVVAASTFYFFNEKGLNKEIEKYATKPVDVPDSEK